MIEAMDDCPIRYAYNISSRSISKVAFKTDYCPEQAVTREKAQNLKAANSIKQMLTLITFDNGTQSPPQGLAT
jgi:hypothetical protein